MSIVPKFKCIVTVIKNGLGTEVVHAARSKGAQGGTIIKGRGTSDAEIKHLFNMFIEPDKEIVLVVIEEEKLKPVKEAIHHKINFDKVGQGILFVLDVEDAIGVLREIK
jgi:nitrogen regulatory protein PII